MISESLSVEAQQALDELRKEEVLPFPLVAYKVLEGDWVTIPCISTTAASTQ